MADAAEAPAGGKTGLPDGAAPGSPTETITRNQAWRTRASAARLSVLSPVYRFDAGGLIAALARECAAQPDLPVELILVDDGSGDPALLSRLLAAIEAFPAPASLIAFAANQGRSAARNRLIAEAGAPFLLFLDSDMLPDQPDFLAAWLGLAQRVGPSIAYGGFSTRQASRAPELALARALAERVDCLPAQDRMARGGLAVATSNLLVRADVVREVPFDDGFRGWGWEDVEWALRAVRAGFAVSHVDIPATHLGLDVPRVLLDKFAQAGPNFVHILHRHPEMAFLASTKAARTLARLPGTRLLQLPMRWLALSQMVPMALRTRAARLWRALHAAHAMRSDRRS